MIWKRRMSPRALVRYAAKHENEYVREYIEALLDEREELRVRIAKVSRAGYTAAARALMIRSGIAFAVFVMIAAAYFTGSAGH